MPEAHQEQVLIVGGGFGGLAVAQALARHRVAGRQITLISNKPHFEYHSALYRVVTGHSALEVCIPLSEVLAGLEVNFVLDEIVSFDGRQKFAAGSSGRRYTFDYGVLALGSVTSYFNIPGLEKFSFGFKSTTEALKLKRHLHEAFAAGISPSAAPEKKVCLLHLVMVGAGPSGVELAGELATYARALAQHHQVDPGLVTIDLLEAAPRILPSFAPAISAIATRRLRALGVNIFTNRTLVKEEVEQITLREMTMKAETVIWTAGVATNTLYQQIPDLTFDPKGRVMVTEHLEAVALPGVFVIGDAAANPYGGLAQTAINQGRFVAEHLNRLLTGKTPRAYVPKKPSYALPIGGRWALALVGPFRFTGRFGWWLRRFADLRYFLSILPFSKALTVFRNDKRLVESCPICSDY